MSLLLTFMELDQLYESTMSRQDLINHIKSSGRNYSFDTKSTEQLFRIWERIQKEETEVSGMQEYHDIISREHTRMCNNCGARLTDSGKCSYCSEDELDYIINDELLEWVDSNGETVSDINDTAVNRNTTIAANTSNIVTIVYDNDKHKLRAQADDGIHGKGYVAFPNNLRTTEGQQYKVATLTWNGKNYRVSGDITPI